MLVSLFLGLVTAAYHTNCDGYVGTATGSVDFYTADPRDGYESWPVLCFLSLTAATTPVVNIHIVNGTGASLALSSWKGWTNGVKVSRYVNSDYSYYGPAGDLTVSFGSSVVVPYIESEDVNLVPSGSNDWRLLKLTLTGSAQVLPGSSAPRLLVQELSSDKSFNASVFTIVQVGGGGESLASNVIQADFTDKDNRPTAGTWLQIPSTWELFPLPDYFGLYQDHYELGGDPANIYGFVDDVRVTLTGTGMTIFNYANNITTTYDDPYGFGFDLNVRGPFAEYFPLTSPPARIEVTCDESFAARNVSEIKYGGSEYLQIWLDVRASVTFLGTAWPSWSGVAPFPGKTLRYSNFFPGTKVPKIAKRPVTFLPAR
jgi:hypothetical protein